MLTLSKLPLLSMGAPLLLCYGTIVLIPVVPEFGIGVDLPYIVSPPLGRSIDVVDVVEFVNGEI